MTDLIAQAEAYAARAKESADEKRARVRALAPEFFELLDKHYGHVRSSCKIIGLVTADGDVLGKPSDEMLAAARADGWIQ